MKTLDKETLQAVRAELGSIINDTIPANGSSATTEELLTMTNERIDRIKSWLNEQIEPAYEPAAFGEHYKNTPSNIATLLDRIHAGLFSDCLKLKVDKTKTDGKYVAGISGLMSYSRSNSNYSPQKGDTPEEAIEKYFRHIQDEELRTQGISHGFPVLTKELIDEWFS